VASLTPYCGLSCPADISVDSASAPGVVQSKAAIRFCRIDEVHRGRVCLWPYLSDAATEPSSKGLVELVVGSLAEALPELFDNDILYCSVRASLVWVDGGGENLGRQLHT